MEVYKWPIILLLLVVFILVRRSLKAARIQKDLIFIQSQFGNKVIHYVLTDNIESLKKLLDQRGYGGNFHAETGESALEIAILNQNKYMIAYLMKYGAIPQPRDLKAAITTNDTGIIEMVKTGNHLNAIREYELSR